MRELVEYFRYEANKVSARTGVAVEPERPGYWHAIQAFCTTWGATMEPRWCSAGAGIGAWRICGVGQHGIDIALIPVGRLFNDDAAANDVISAVCVSPDRAARDVLIDSYDPKQRYPPAHMKKMLDKMHHFISNPAPLAPHVFGMSKGEKPHWFQAKPRNTGNMLRVVMNPNHETGSIASKSLFHVKRARGQEQVATKRAKVDKQAGEDFAWENCRTTAGCICNAAKCPALGKERCANCKKMQNTKTIKGGFCGRTACIAKKLALESERDGNVD